MTDFAAEGVRLIQGDVRTVLPTLPSCSVHCCVTSPPYWGLRDYGVDGQLGLEKSPEEYVANMVAVFREVRRVLRDDGTLWLNMGDSYASTPPGNTKTGVEKWKTSGLHGGVSPRYAATLDASVSTKRNTIAHGLKPKDLVGIPWLLAFALRADGWYLRSDIIWHKPNPMPESVSDRPTKAHEYLFMLTKKPRYFYDAEAIRERAVGPPGGNVKPTKGAGTEKMRTRNGLHVAQQKARDAGGFENRNKRSVWTVPTHAFPGAHFATFPPKLIVPCIKAGTSEEGCCQKCGAPWRRVLKKKRVRTRPGRDSKSCDRSTGDVLDDGIEKPWRDRAEIGNRDPGRHVSVTKTVGWKAGCDCNAGSPIPCTVLDPFHGSGTTCEVSLKLGRHYVGVELSQEYLDMSVRERIARALRERKEMLF